MSTKPLKQIQIIRTCKSSKENVKSQEPNIFGEYTTREQIPKTQKVIANHKKHLRNLMKSRKQQNVRKACGCVQRIG